ncbi:DUF2946 family protein [Thermomonas sp.]|uniref:DUF2946 family protein n=1 Tax=Thermomonas sp. TaxID=1971895 RepID=UPI003D09B8C4
MPRALRRLRPALHTLALLAAWLLVLVPTAGRLYQARGDDVARLGLLCTSDGLRAGVIWPGGFAAGPAGSGAPEDPAGHALHSLDCAYCPLLAQASLPSPPRVVLLPPARPAFALSLRPALRVPARHLLGWAPRGPPVAIVV